MQQRANGGRGNGAGRPLRLRTLVAGLAVGTLAGTAAFVATSPSSGIGAVPTRGDGAVVEVAGIAVERTGDVPGEVVDAALASVLRVHASGCGQDRTASATRVLTHDGRPLLLTNAHVVAGSSEARLVRADGTEITVDVLGSIHGVDAALLASPDGSGAHVTPLPLGPPVDVGAPVVVAGHPGGAARLDATRVIAAEMRVAPGGMSQVFLTGSEAEGGHSGGAVLDLDGRAVGLVVARDPSTGRVVAHPIGEVLASPLVTAPGC